MAARRQPRSIVKHKIPGRNDKILALVPIRSASSDASGKSESDEDELHVPNSDSSSPAPSINSSLMNLSIDSSHGEAGNGFYEYGNGYDFNENCVNKKTDKKTQYNMTAQSTPIRDQTADVSQGGQNIINENDNSIQENHTNVDRAMQTSEKAPSNNNDNHDDVPLSPIIAEVYPNNDKDPDYSMIPSISSLPSLPSIGPSTPDSPYDTKRPHRKEIAQSEHASRIRNIEKPNYPYQSNARRKLARKALPFSNSPPSVLSCSPRIILQAKRNTRSKCPKTTVTAKKVKKSKKMTLNYAWKKTVFNHRADLEKCDVDYEDIAEIDTAMDLFSLYFSPDILSDIVEQTNAYSLYETGKSINLTQDELRDFLVILIIMGIVDMPSYCDYWSKRLRYPMVADLMTLKRFQKIRRYIHFADNTMDTSDRYFKIRPFLEKIRKNCLAQERENKFSIDEMMIPYKGKKAGNRRQYMKDKPTKWGFKNFVRAGVSGMIYDFILYGAEDTFRGYKFTEKEASVGFGAQIVLALCKSIKQKPATVYCDNFFSSPELMYILRHDYGIFGLGTIRGNRLRGAENLLPSDKEMRKKPRGNFSQVVSDQKLAIVKWYDNKAVTFVSSYVATEPVEKIKRYCKNAKAKVDVDCPKAVKEYNRHMGGVDLADMLIALYKTPFKCRRWYMAIFVQMLDICINNAWLLGRHKKASSAGVPLKQFRLEIYHGLIQANRSVKRDKIDCHDVKNPAKPRPVNSVRYDEVGHFPSTKTEGRCCLCMKNTTVFCIKCDFRMCFVTGKNPRNCFLSFHTKKL